MEDVLVKKLEAYLRENNPEVVLALEAEDGLQSYLLAKLAGVATTVFSMIDEGVPRYIIEESCMELMTESLRPSRFNYIKEILDEEFHDYYKQLLLNGLLVYEAVNIMDACFDAFEAFGFTEEDEDNRALRLAVIGSIDGYLVGVKM